MVARNHSPGLCNRRFIIPSMVIIRRGLRNRPSWRLFYERKRRPIVRAVAVPAIHPNLEAPWENQ